MYTLSKRPTIKLFTMATDLNDVGLTQFKQTADKWEWDYDIFHLNRQIIKSANGAAQYKMELLKYIWEHLKYNHYDFVGIVDGYDLLVNNSPEECIKRLYENNLQDTLVVGIESIWNVKPFPIIYNIHLFDNLINTIFKTMSFSQDCKKPYNLGMVLGSSSNITLYISKMLSLWNTKNICNSKICSEQKYFEKTLQCGTFTCENNTLYIDENEHFVKNFICCFIKNTNTNTIFLHFPGKRYRCNLFGYQTHFYNTIMNNICNTDCFICNNYMLYKITCFVLICIFFMYHWKTLR